MTPTEATTLATRILASFHGPPLLDWEEELEPLDPGRAGTAYARLRREHEHRWLSIGQYLGMYRSLHTLDASNRPPECGWCGYTGWTETARHVAHSQPYTGVEPCTHCPEGRARAASAAWREAPHRGFISDAEAERLIAAERKRNGAPVRFIDPGAIPL